MTRSAGTSGLTLRRVAPEVGHRVAHDRQVDDRRNAGEVLEQDPRRHERDLGLGGGAGPPRQQRLDVRRPRRRHRRHAGGAFSSRILTVTGRLARSIRSRDGVEPVEVWKAGPERRAGAEGIVDGMWVVTARLLRQPRRARGQSAPGGCAHPGSKFALSIRRQARVAAGGPARYTRWMLREETGR